MPIQACNEHHWSHKHLHHQHDVLQEAAKEHDSCTNNLHNALGELGYKLADDPRFDFYTPAPFNLWCVADIASGRSFSNHFRAARRESRACRRNSMARKRISWLAG